jgi:RNA polymerase sigma factor (sigma-70 family)
VGKQDNYSSNSIHNFDPVRGRQILIAAIKHERAELMIGINLYLWKLGAVNNRAQIDDKAKEIFQEMSLTAHRKAADFDPDLPPRPWLLTIAINHIRHLRRTHISENRRLVQLQEVPPPSPQKNSFRVARAEAEQSENESFNLESLEKSDATIMPAHPVSKGEANFNELISEVSEPYQIVLRLRFIEGLRGKELAAELKINEGAANTRLSRALAELRRIHKV